MIDRRRLEAELAADASVLASLRSNGDVARIIRPVDVRFVGSPADVAILEAQIGALGWRVVQRISLDDGSEALDVARDQATDQTSIRRLTEDALIIEQKFNVSYDGWGTVASKP